MDEALRRIERQLAGQAQKSRIDQLLPPSAPKPQCGDDMAITHLSKSSTPPAASPEADSAPAPIRDALAQPARPQPADDIYKKITAGGREFSLDELGNGGDSGTEVVDPLMGPVLKPSSSYRDVSLDELDVNITPDGPQPKH